MAKSALAVCPICTVAVGAGIGLSRWLGIDDSITGLWIGGLVVSVIYWTIDWLDRKKVHFMWRNFVVWACYYIIVVVPLYFINLLPPKIIIGTVVGSVGFWFGADLYEHMKNKNDNKAHFPFQKVLMPIAPLIIMSIIFYFLV